MLCVERERNQPAENTPLGYKMPAVMEGMYTTQCKFVSCFQMYGYDRIFIPCNVFALSIIPINWKLRATKLCCVCWA